MPQLTIPIAVTGAASGLMTSISGVIIGAVHVSGSTQVEITLGLIYAGFVAAVGGAVIATRAWMKREAEVAELKRRMHHIEHAMLLCPSCSTASLKADRIQAENTPES